MSSATVLLVEDHAELRSLIVATLGRRHVVCEGVATPQEAVLKLRQDDRYSYVLLDVQGALEGDPVIRYLTDDVDGGMSRLVLIGDDDPREEQNDAYSGPFLRKPFDMNELCARLAIRLQS